jgi:hypothetical protein
MRRAIAVLGALLVYGSLAAPAAAAPQDTDIPGVTAEVVFLRQYNGVLHLGVALHNPGDKPAAGSNTRKPRLGAAGQAIGY